MNLHETPAPASSSKLEHLDELPPEVASWGRPFKERDKDLEYVQRHYDSLEKKFPAEWIAVYNKAIVAHSPKHAQLWRELKRLRITEKSPVTFYIAAPLSDD